MYLKSKGVQLGLAVALGVIVMLLPRPEGTRFKISGIDSRTLMQHIGDQFTMVPDKLGKNAAATFVIQANQPGSQQSTAAYIAQKSNELDLTTVQVDYVDGLSPKAKRLLAVMAVLLFLFVAEPIPLEVTALCIGVLLVITGVGDLKSVWAAYMHPVVVFIMCCLIFAISLDKAGITKRMGFFIVRKAGDSVIRFTFILTIGLGMASAFMHDAAACAIGIVTMLPLMRAAGIEPHTRTAKFMMLSLPFAASCGGMGSLIGGALVTNAMANVAAAALILPIVIPMAQLEGVNPAILALCLGQATSFAMLLVIGCPPNAIAYSYRYFKASDLTKAGAVATPILLGVLVLVAAVWWKILDLV